MSAFISLAGQRFGKWTVLGRCANKGTCVKWSCRCDCGNEVSVHGTSLRRGISTQCQRCASTIHGMAGQNTMNNTSPEYTAWWNAKRRCTSPRDPKWKDYGGRGITMDTLWLISFDAFYKHIGPRPDGHILDREDNDKGYIPGNVRWVTYAVSNLNRRNKRKLNASVS